MDREEIMSQLATQLYSLQGTKTDYDDLNGTMKLDYINIPILANVYVAKGLAVKAGIFSISNL